ncbi:MULTISPECIES: energy transducer TonB [unclassified Variovorax]|uniref:energy transducer TonB n=1 Tax=unclassified Variovorax TaxID=663243 RepID=UPI003F479E66
MTSSVPFLRYLDLDESADERAVRRAYAQRLKTVDQEADPAGFQALREAYETSMRWLQWRLQQQAEDHEQPEPAPAPLPAPEPEAVAAAEPIATPHDPRAIAEVLRAELAQALHERHFTKAAPVRECLQQALDDPRLIDMDARFFFEWGVTAILASGWQPGHELLFEVAVETFDWRHDRARLLSLGREGQIVDSAIVEFEAFSSRGAPIYNGASREQLIQLLRKNERPESQVLIMCTSAVEHMVSLYPHWLHIVTNSKNVAQWRAWERELTSAQATDDPPHMASKPPSLARTLALVVLLFVVLGVLLWWSAPADKATAGVSPALALATPEAREEAVRQLEAETVDAPARYRTPPSISYPSQAKRDGLQGRVIVGVLIRKNGEIGEVRVMQGSGHALLDEAAVRAIRNASFYPARVDSQYVDAWFNAPINFRLGS